MHKDNHHKYHGLIMLLCCLVPILLIAALPLLKGSSSSLKSLLGFGIFLLCPLMHIFMMKKIHENIKTSKTHTEDHHSHDKPHLPAQQGEEKA